MTGLESFLLQNNFQNNSNQQLLERYFEVQNCDLNHCLEKALLS